MNRQAFLSMPLSFAIVLVASIALSGPRPGPDRQVAGGKPGAGPQGPGTVATAGGTVSFENPNAIEVDDVPPAGSDVPILVAEMPAAPPVPGRNSADSLLVGRPTVVASGPGETIADIAARVYGTKTLIDALLDLNADVAIEPGRPLPAGTLLRLP